MIYPLYQTHTPVYEIHVPSSTITQVVNAQGDTLGPTRMPDPEPSQIQTYQTAVPSRDPLEHLNAEAHRRRSKQTRKSRRPAWRR